jgi:macrodomain Ter protein organizer (MatP/YcbG family)
MTDIFKIINTEIDRLKELNVYAELEGSYATNEYIFPYSDVDLKVYTKTPYEDCYSLHTHWNYIYPILKYTNGEDGTSMYSMIYYKDDVRFELSFYNEHIRSIYKENEKYRMTHLVGKKKQSYMNKKRHFYMCISNADTLKNKDAIALTFKRWKRDEINKYKIYQHPYSYECKYIGDVLL